MTRFRILPARSKVWIEARSNVHAINTEADGLQGWLEVDMGDHKITGLESRGRVEFPVVNLKSGNTMEDREMQRRIDARSHPTIAGDLRTITSTHEPMRYLVRGDVTFRGVTRAYEDEMTLENIDDRTIGLSGESTFDIRDFGMQPPRILLLKVHPEVVVRVRIVAEVAEEESPPV